MAKLFAKNRPCTPHSARPRGLGRRVELLEPTGLHVAIIMDGNGRWAQARGLPRVAGHRAGVEAVRRVVRAAPGLGISTLTLYAFSADNWQRPQPEVTTLMRLMHEYLLTETHPWAAHGIRVSVIGPRMGFREQDRKSTRLNSSH